VRKRSFGRGSKQATDIQRNAARTDTIYSPPPLHHASSGQWSRGRDAKGGAAGSQVSHLQAKGARDGFSFTTPVATVVPFPILDNHTRQRWQLICQPIAPRNTKKRIHLRDELPPYTRLPLRWTEGSYVMRTQPRKCICLKCL